MYEVLLCVEWESAVELGAFWAKNEFLVYNSDVIRQAFFIKGVCNLEKYCNIYFQI